jgi:hypothetical protein
MREHIVKLVADTASRLYFREGLRGAEVPGPRLIDGELGVLFEGTEFIPYNDLGYNRELGFFRLSSFSEYPEYANEALPFSADGVILSLGAIVMTSGVEYDLENAGLSAEHLYPILGRYSRGDFGRPGSWRDTQVTDQELQGGAYVTADDDRLNLINTLSGINRIMAIYDIEPIGILWIITEADRSVTTILKPEEY